MLRRILGQAVGLFLVGALLAPPAMASEPAALAGTNVVSGSHTSRVTVRLDHDAVLDLTPVEAPDGTTLPRALQVTGGDGDFVGFALSEPLTTEGFFAVALRTPELGRDGFGWVGYGQPAVEHRDEPGLLPADPPSCVRCTIPAGDYHLFLVTGRPDVRVTFTLEGLGGTTQVTPDAGSLATNLPTSDFGTWFEGNGGPVTGGGFGRWFMFSTNAPQPGLLVHAYRTTATASGDVPMVVLVEHCEAAGEQRVCQQRTDVASTHDAPGFTVTPGAMTDRGVETTVDLVVTGAASYTVGQAMLWLPLDHFIGWVGGGGQTQPGPDVDVRTWTHAGS